MKNQVDRLKKYSDKTFEEVSKKLEKGDLESALELLEKCRNEWDSYFKSLDKKKQLKIKHIFNYYMNLLEPLTDEISRK